MTQQETKIRIGITQGDINGIGMEVTVKALANPDILELFTPVLFGNRKILDETVSALKIENFPYTVINDEGEIKEGEVNLVETGSAETAATPGNPSEAGGKAAVDALAEASRWIENGALDLLVTAPIDKHTAQSDSFKFPGHTEYLQKKFAVGGGEALMILADEHLRVALLSTHLPLSQVAKHVTKERIITAIKDFNRALKMDFGCERPRIAVLSLNPHCGDNGTLGNEETEEIIPALEECKKEGILAFGPIAADGFFGSGAYVNYDGVLAMYHDQGLAPFKAIAAGRGYNFTAGLDIIRTSPAHGTAYDKAGKGEADESSMRDAIYAAIDIARRRDSYLDATENPLESHPVQQKGGKKKENSETSAGEESIE